MMESAVLRDARASFVAAVKHATHSSELVSALDDVLAWSADHAPDVTVLGSGDQDTVGVGLTDGGAVLWRVYPRQRDGAKIVVLPGVFGELAEETRAAVRAAFDEAVPGGEFARTESLEGPLVLLADEVIQRQFRVALAAALAALKVYRGGTATEVERSSED